MGRLQDSPPLTRFVIERKKVTINPADGSLRVKAKLFEPYQGKVSVFQTETWPEDKVRDCGIAVARERGKRLYGWVILSASEVPDQLPLGQECQLTVEFDNTPPGHANIIGWPSDKDDVLEWQGELADHSTPFPLPNPV